MVNIGLAENGVVLRREDEHVHVASMLGIPLDELAQMSFSWVTPEDMDLWTGGSCSHSCAIGTRAFSLSPILYHELAHAVCYGVNSRPAHFLSEGFATLLDPFQLIGEALPDGPRF